LTVLFISHSLGVIEEIADRVGVMYGGKLMVGANEMRQASINSGFASDVPIGFPFVGPRFARHDRAAALETVRDVVPTNEELAGAQEDA
jgi:ABC-type multidrug transport system ATPase subunit